LHGCSCSSSSSSSSGLRPSIQRACIVVRYKQQPQLTA
jgi:hypothetical protein